MSELNIPRRTKRTYHSPARQRQAEETRGRVLGTARTLFAERGYAGTTIEAIAEGAGISPKTVVAGFGSKRAILAEVLDPAGLDSAHTEVLEHLRAESNPAQRLRLVARLACDVYTASATEFDLLRGAETIAPELAELSRVIERRRRERQEGLVASLRTHGALPAERSDEVVLDELWAFTSFDLYRLLVLQSGWSPERYVAWLGEVLIERLLAR